MGYCRDNKIQGFVKQRRRLAGARYVGTRLLPATSTLGTRQAITELSRPHIIIELVCSLITGGQALTLVACILQHTESLRVAERILYAVP